MPKIVIDEIASGYSLSKINDQFNKIESYINDKVLSRDSDGNANAMSEDLDMNSNQILNLPAPTAPTAPVRLGDIPDLVKQTQGANYVGTTAPESAFEGMRWYDPSVPTTYVYDTTNGVGSWIEEPVQSRDTLLTVENYGAVGDGATNDADAFLKMQASVGYIGLSPEKVYFVSALPSVATLIIIGRNATIRYNTLLVDRTFTLLDIQDVNFDAQGADLTRCIRVRKNSQVKFRNVNGYNINSSTFVRMFDISTENVNIDIEDCYCQNLVSAEDGTVGNNNGATRFIYVGDEDATPLVSPSFGRIVGIRGNVVLPKEDGDMIHVQSSDSKIFNITIDDIFGYKVAKRVVKVQANGVYVSNVVADARDNSVAMYAIVSHYGQYGSVSNVSGAGKFEQGVDTQYETTPFRHINVTNTGAAVSQGAAFKGAGGMTGSDIYGYGFEHVVGNYNSLVSNANTDVSRVSGTATGVPIFVRASLVSGAVNIDGVRVSTSAAARLIQVTRTASNTFTTVDINDVVGSCGLFTAVDVTGASITKGKNIDITQTVSGIPFTVNAGEAYCEDIVGRGTSTDAVFLNATTKAVVTRARGGTSAQVITSGCNNSIVNNAICAAGVPASRNTGTASTNTQNIGTLTFV